MDKVERFAVVANAFQKWALHGKDSGELTARKALLFITRLYLFALELPPVWSDRIRGGRFELRGSLDDGDDVYESMAARLPFSHYGLVFNSAVLPPQEPVHYGIAEDVQHVYIDIMKGLRLYQEGRRAEAVWHWGFYLQCHWGDHATGAIRGLHCWLATHSPDSLQSSA